jgi:hypothetical protein
MHRWLQVREATVSPTQFLPGWVAFRTRLVAAVVLVVLALTHMR